MRQFLRELYRTIPKVKTRKGKRRARTFKETREGLSDGKLSTYYPKRNRRRLVLWHGKLKIVEAKKETSSA